MTKLDVRAFGLACGILWAACVLFMGIMDFFTGWADIWVELLANVYIGYKPTIVGSIIGAVWGFVDAGVGGLLLAWLYNKLAK